MTRLVRFGFVAALCGLAGLNAASCSVDKSGFTFDDDAYARASKEGDDDNGSGGGDGPDPGSNGGEGGVPIVVEGGDAPELCDISTMRCTGRQVELCTETGWMPAGGQCEFGCLAGVCSGTCVPSTKRCETGIKEQTCNAAGDWETGVVCEFACIGDFDAGACGGVCLPNTTGCGTDDFDPDFEPEDLLLCGLEGQWSLQQTCTGYCTPTGTPATTRVTTGVCGGACTPGDEQCIVSGGQAAVETCGSNNEWGDLETGNTVTPCGAGIPCSDAECGECVPGTTDCQGLNAKTCDSFGHWPDEPNVCELHCLDGVGCTACAPGEARCGGKPGQSVVQQCTEEGKWKTADVCFENGLQCVLLGEAPGTPKCRECNPGAQRCSFRQPQVCDEDGTWRDQGLGCITKGAPICEGGECLSEGAIQCNETFPDGPTGCFTEKDGWICESRGAPPVVVECDCRNGQGCQPRE